MLFRSDLLAGKKDVDPSLKDALPKDFDPNLADQQINDKFARFARQSLETRAKNVKHKEGILDEIGPLFEKKFKLKEDEPTEELQGGVLNMHRLPEGERIEAVMRDGEVKSKGVVEVEVSAMGLSSMTAFHIVNSDNEYMTIYWDPLTGRGVARQGKLDL